MRGWTQRQEAGRVLPQVSRCAGLPAPQWREGRAPGTEAGTRFSEVVRAEDAASTGASRPACGSEGICPSLSGAWLQVRCRW